MVLESNIQFNTVNRYVISFISSLAAAVDGEDACLSEACLESILSKWNQKANIHKLKSQMKKYPSKNPKRIVSKYLYYCEEERQTIIDENPNMNIKDVTCELGRRWQKFQECPDQKRLAKISKLYDADRIRYESEKLNLINNKSGGGGGDAKPKKIIKSPYLVFCAEQRQTSPNISMKELGILWNITKRDIDQYQKYKSIALQL